MEDSMSYITEIIQRGRIKPSRYRHYLRMPRNIYDRLRDANIIRPEDYFLTEAIFFEYDYKEVTLNFVSKAYLGDLHVRILSFLVKDMNEGTDPIIRGGLFDLRPKHLKKFNDKSL